MVNWKGVSDLEGLRGVVVEVLSEAHDNLAEAQVVSRQKGEGVYGQIWRSLCNDLVVRLRAERLEVQVIKPPSFPYELPVLGDAILFPWRPAGGRTPAAITFGTSLTRQRLWEQSLSQDLLPLEIAAVNGRVQEDDGQAEVVVEAVAEVVADAARHHLRVVVAAMTSDARRLRRIEWGEAELDSKRVLLWSPETLYSLDDAPAPASTSPQTFADGEAPTPGVTLKPKAQPKSAAGGNDGSTDTSTGDK